MLLVGKAYMSKAGVANPSYANFNKQGSLVRSDSCGVFPVDVIMAIKLMKPSAYNVDYKPARQGEDIGWSLHCKEKGLKLGWTGEVTSRHVMSKKDLDKNDIRIRD